jgi:hypothetical protein
MGGFRVRVPRNDDSLLRVRWFRRRKWSCAASPPFRQVQFRPDGERIDDDADPDGCKQQ